MKKLSFYVNRKTLFLLFHLLLAPLLTSSMVAGLSIQSKVTGKVTDSDGLPIAGVNIVVESKNVGSISDMDGSFSIQAGPNDVLVFSMVGFKHLSVPIFGRDEIIVQMQEDVTALGEVVLNAGYYTVSEKERTGSIVKVKSMDLEKQPISNPIAGLQGRATGVQIQQTSGLPGANFNIQIRGQNSIRSVGNDPLYIIDGVPFSSVSLGEQQASIALPGTGISPLNNLDPNTIESIEILKDADATAIYGSRGANGVVLITTKKGKGGPTQISFNVFTGLGSVTNTLDMLNTAEYLELRNEAYANDGVDPIPDNAYDVNGTWNPNRYTNWQKELFGKTAFMTNLQGSISGGDQHTQFLVSGNYHGQTDVLPGDYTSSKVSGLANISHRTLDDRFSVQLSTNYSSAVNNLPNANSMVTQGIVLPPNAPELYQEDGSLNWENSTWDNPLRHLKDSYNSRTTTFIGNMRLAYTLMPELQFMANLGYTENHIKEIRLVPSTRIDPAFGIGSENSYAVHNTGERNSWIIEPQLVWNHGFGKLSLQSLVGLSFQEQSSEQLSLQAFGFSSNSLIESKAAANDLSVFGDINQKYRYQAIFGRLNFNYQGKYIVNLTGRRDGSSRFGPNKRFSNFGAAGLAWVFSEEPFMQKTFPFLSFAKIKGSYGTSGNDQIGDYQYLDTYSFSNLQYQNSLGLYPTRLFNPDFSWELNKKMEVSLELGLFKDRIRFIGNYYRSRSSNQLVGIPLPATTGFGSIIGNLEATVENTGIELELATVNIQNKNFRWSSSFNLTIPKNKLVSFPDLEGSTYANQLVIGEPLNSIKLYQLNGVDPETGLYEFEDFNGDGEITSVDDKQVIKHMNPEFFGGLNNSLSLGKFNLDVLFQFSKQMGFNYWRNGSIPGSNRNLPQRLLQRWQTEGDMAPVQRMTVGRSLDPLIGYFNHQQSDAVVSDASYLRLKTLSISYTLMDKIKGGIGCEIYARGQNLWTWTDYFGLDPETQSTQTVPSLRILSLGTIIKF
ncbi:SusC/RagA family TonB-linked outer membrane protein [Flagellimonas zhangzhouensis]|uniref:TonB-linked outer membrane protein, SusC/RagA family n=1 Tax=Flagellimonas zhangzhouensis TaxID=1073328 RepID=A0A1H2RCU1_9FLAO|nr:TonB-dependent receptor [Allomuricauda zhangzhouensis]SDQ62154.1 TonB-linked outer membrane protein, SusC/RagA family [Allomuricauda zhangzhouensis]SDW17125.1 TonB-linked outer membrane protein, SusC/RagA family [Allomuricauda zhangzhouensis]